MVFYGLNVYLFKITYSSKLLNHTGDELYSDKIALTLNGICCKWAYKCNSTTTRKAIARYSYVFASIRGRSRRVTCSNISNLIL